MKRVLGLMLISSRIVSAQCTIDVTAPTASQTISGTSVKLTSSSRTCPSVYSVEYLVDGESQGHAYGPTFTLPWNSNNISNGSNHTIAAVARDALNATIATSTSVLFKIDNQQLYSDGAGTYDAQLSVTPSCTSNCSGVISFTLTVTGSWSTLKNWLWSLYVDGMPWVSDAGVPASNPNTTEKLDTRAFYDGAHSIIITGTQGTSAFVAQYQQSITFLNGSLVPAELRTSAREVFMQPAGTYTLSSTLYNADGSTVSSPTIKYYSQNPAVATVGQSTGIITAVGFAPNAVQLGAMSSVTTGTLTIQVPGTVLLSGRFTQAMKGDVLRIISGPGCTSGFYVLNGAGAGSASVTTSAGAAGSSCSFATGPSRLVWVFINSRNILPHFSRNGSILTSWSDTASAYVASMFQNSAGAGGQQYRTYWIDFAKAGWNTMEIEGAECLPGTAWNGSSCAPNTSQSAWQMDITNYVATWANTALTNGLYIHLINDNWWRGDPEMFQATRAAGGGSAWRPTAIQWLYQSWGAQNACTPSSSNKCYGAVTGGTQYDEVNSTYGQVPLPGMIGFGHGNLSQIVATGGTCTGTYPGWSFSANHFVLSGATTMALNSVSPNVYVATGLNSSTFTFSCPGVANGIYNSGTDPNLNLQPFAFAWHSGDYVRYDAFQNIMNWANTASPARPVFTWTTAAATSNTADHNWMGDSRMSDYAELYYGPSAQLISPNHSSAYTLISDMGDFYRSRLPNLQDGKPWVGGNAEGIVIYYGFTGTNVSISSISGDVVTLSGPHGITSVVPGVTRVQVSGSSNSAYNGNFLIRSTPTGSSIQIYMQPTVSVNSGGGTMTFSNGDAYLITGINAGSPPFWSTNRDPASGCVIPNYRGMNFTISDTGSAWDGSGTYYYPLNDDSDSSCPAPAFFGGNFYLVPAGSSTGGTASIIPDNYFVRGRNISGPSTGPQYIYAAHIYPAILGAAGTRTYTAGIDQQGPRPPNTKAVVGSYNPSSGQYNAQAVANNSRFNNFSEYTAGNGIQQGPFPLITTGGIADAWYAGGMANLLMIRFAKFLFQPRLRSPDYGQGFEATARSGNNGNLLLIQNFWNASRALTVRLAPYLISGQSILKYYCTYLDCAITVLTAGTSSDTVNFDAVGTVWYVFSSNAAAEYSPMVISTRLADVLNATKIVVWYAYAPHPLINPAGNGRLNSFDCGTGTCRLPVDQKIGTVYYKLLYLDSNGALLATSQLFLSQLRR